MPDEKPVKNWIIFFTLLACASVSVLMLLPVVDDRRGLDILLSILRGDTEKTVDIGELSENWWVYPEIQPYQIYSVPQFNWSHFWQVFKNHALWDLEYKDNGDWISCKQNLTIIRDYLEDNTCKLTLDFTAPYTADYRLTLAIDYRVKEYANRSGQYEYMLTYEVFNESFNAVFNWSDLAEIPGVIITHGIKEIDGHNYFWFRARRNNVPEDYHIILDPTYTVYSGSLVFSDFSAARKLVRLSNGTLYCCFVENQDVHVAWSDDAGVNWNDIEIYGARASIYPSIAVDSNDRVHFVWQGYSAADTDDYQIRYSNSSDWTTHVDIVDEDLDHWIPAIAVDSSDNLHVVYELDDSTDSEVYYLNSTDNGGSWSAITKLTNEASALDDTWIPSIAINSTDSIHVVFMCEDHYSNKDDILHMQSDDCGITWTDWEADPVYQASDNQRNPCLVIDDNDVLRVTWYSDEGTSDVIRYSYNDSSSWSTSESFTNNSNTHQQYPSIAVDGNEYVHITWSGPNDWINYIYNDTSSWSSITNLSSDSGGEYPNMISAQHPTVSGAKTNRPATNYALIYANGTTSIIYNASPSLTWDSGAPPTNNAPTQTGESPTNQSTGIDVSGGVPDLYVICNDTDAGDTMNATWRSNNSGAWVTFATNSSISPGTNITQSNANFSTELTKYWWSINLTDATDWCNATYHFTTQANVTRTWQNISTGWFSFSNTSAYGVIESGWFTFQNTSSWSIVESGWFSFENTSTYNIVESGWFTFENTSTYNLLESGWFSFSNTSAYGIVESGWFSFTATTRTNQTVESGWFSFSNTSTFSIVESGWFSFENTSVKSWQTVESGWFSFSNTSSYELVESGWFSFSNTSTFASVSTGWFSFSNTTEYTTISQGWFSFENTSSFSLLTSGWFTFSNSTLRIWETVATGWFTFSNTSEFQIITFGWFNFSNSTIVSVANFVFTISGSTVICTSTSTNPEAIEYYRWNITVNGVSIGSTDWIDDESGSSHSFTFSEGGTYHVTLCVMMDNITSCMTKGTGYVPPAKDKYDPEDYITCKSCEDAGYYWYDGECHEASKPLPWNEEREEELPEAGEHDKDKIEIFGWKVDIGIPIFFIILILVFIAVFRKKKEK